MFHPHLFIKDAGPKGRGVYTKSLIYKGELIAKFTGWVLLTAQLTDDLFALQIDHDAWLCSYGDQLDDCINHSCEPNTGFLTGETALYALRDIRPQEEISFDYTTSLSEKGWHLLCACGSHQCRKTVLSWPEMPSSYQEAMLPFALNYIKKVSA